MNLSTLFYACQYQINMLSLIACLLLAVEHVNIVLVRKPPYPWASYSVSLLLLGLAADRLYKIMQHHYTDNGWQLISQYLLNIFIIAAAILIPWVRRATYKRPRFQQLQEVNRGLQYSQNLLRSYLDEAPVLAYIKDREGKITHINAGFKRLLGETSENLIGQKYLWGDTDESQDRDQKILSGKGQKELVQTVHLKDGEGTILDIRFPLIAPNHERLLGGIAVDLTNQLRRKNRIEVFASIVDFAPDAIYSQDKNGLILTWNKAAETMFGYTADQIIGQSATLIMTDENQNDMEKFGQLFEQKSGSVCFESSRKTKQKEAAKKEVLVAAAYVPASEPSVAVIIRDISAKKETETKISMLNQELEEKVRQLSQTNIDLQKARDEALEAAGAKSAFVANISHELRTPLSGILGMSELLARKKLDDDSHKLVTLLEQSAQELLHVVEDILDLAKLEAGKTTIEEETLSVPQLLNDCQKHFAPSLAAKCLNWRTDIDPAIPPLIKSDANVLRRILFSLISNGINFTESGEINVKVSVDKADENTLSIKFSVSDTGIGIGKDVLPMLFTPFAKISQSSEGVAGKGLGLILCKQLTSLLHGQIGCHSEKAKGATFWFTARVDTVKTDFPAQTLHLSQNETHEIPPMSPTELRRYRALSVDDSPVVSQLTMRQLDIIGIPSNSAITGTEAIKKAEQTNFDVILMDVHLPDMTGYTAAREIRKVEATQGKSRSVIIALTGCTADELQEMEDATVIDGFLEKPVSIDSLRTSLIKALRQRAANIS